VESVNKRLTETKLLLVQNVLYWKRNKTFL